MTKHDAEPNRWRGTKTMVPGRCHSKKTSRKEGRKEGKSKEAGDETLPSRFSPVTSGGKGEGAVTVTTVVSVVIMVVVWLLVAVGLSALQT